MTDTELINDFIHTIRCHYQSLYPGHDTYIDRSNLKEHLLSMVKESDKANSRIDAIALIANGE